MLYSQSSLTMDINMVVINEILKEIVTQIGMLPVCDVKGMYICTSKDKKIEILFPQMKDIEYRKLHLEYVEDVYVRLWVGNKIVAIQYDATSPEMMGKIGDMLPI